MTAGAGQTPEFWDERSKRYDRVEISPYAEDVLRLVGTRSGDRVLDVAAGPGTLALLAARMGATVTAVDFAPAMIASLRTHAVEEGLTNITAEVMDGQALALPDDSFDAAFSMFGLIFFPDRAAGFREMHRVLRPGGVAAVTSWGAIPHGGLRLAQRAAARVLPHLPPVATPIYLSLQSPQAFAQEMSAAGFADVHIETIMHHKEACTPDEAWQPAQGWVAATTRDDAEREAVRAAFFDLLHAEHGDGPVRFHGEAHIGIGTK